MDRRIEKTEQAFTDALFHFLKEKELKKITVKEICEYCNMNRGTFYLHYYDIYDLMEKTEQKMIDMIFEDFPDDMTSPREDLLKSFEYIKSHREEYKIIFSANTQVDFSIKLGKTLVNRSKKTIKDIMPKTDESVARNAAMFYVGGAVALLYGWIVDNDCKTSPVELINTANSIYDYLYNEKQRLFESGVIKENAVKD